MKQRLTGTVVIGCLAIIFIPILLDGEGVTPPQMSADIPLAPPMPAIPRTEPVRPQIGADIPPSVRQRDADGTAAGDGGAPASDNPSQPRLTEQGIPETWSVRLGSFGEIANAEALVTRLREQGYKGYSRPLDTSRGPLTGVYVGPVLTQEDAAELQQELAAAFGLEGAVVQFAIEELEQ